MSHPTGLGKTGGAAISGVRGDTMGGVVARDPIAYTYIYIYIYIYIHTHTHKYVHTYIYTYVYVHVCLYTLRRTNESTHTHTQRLFLKTNPYGTRVF